jgi:thiol:disulfide interchange protein DsbD
MRHSVIVRSALAALLAVALACGAASSRAAAAPPHADDLVQASLYAESASAAPGQTLWLDVHLTVASGWHIYWKNPGDSGLPTTVAWALPPDFAAGNSEFPIPERFAVGPIGNYGYGGAVDLLTPVAVPAGFAGNATAHLGATVDYLVCSEICIPGSAPLSLDLPAGSGAADPAQAARFAAARQKLPLGASFAAQFAVTPQALRLIVPAAAWAGLDHPSAEFFPDADNAIDNAAAGTVEIGASGLTLTLPRSANPNAAVPKSLDGVLVVKGGDGTARGYRISAAEVPVAAGGDAASLFWWQALLFSFVGGLILNLMPCVLPILSLKVLSFAALAESQKRRQHGLAYASGVLLSFAALGGALIALRGAGAAVGWGFQLQSPPVVALLAYLMLAMGLSLSGVAEFGAGFAGYGGRFAERSGLAGAFFTGVLATLVATPCTAPFMGAALGAALVAPPLLALTIFVALGAGLAAPMLAASFVPGVARILPRPGRWMATLKQLLAFPLYATAAWLVWVVIQEVGSESALMALFGLVLVGFAVWAYGRSRLATARARRGGGLLAAAGLAVAVVLAVMLRPASEPAKLAADALPYEAFTPARLAALTAEHKPVFVNLTAAWCLTCIVNERATLDRDAVRDAFAAHHIVALKGDWTRQDPEIARFLQSFGRSGVPLYLLYDGKGSPTVLPQILTQAGIIDAVDRL